MILVVSVIQLLSSHKHLSGAHTIGNSDNTNILISFTSFDNDGFANTCSSLPWQDGARPFVTIEDRQQHKQYEKYGTSVSFYSLKDFDTCTNVEEFLDKMRQKIGEAKAKAIMDTAIKDLAIKDKRKGIKEARTSLFLQDFPSGGTFIYLSLCIVQGHSGESSNKIFGNTWNFVPHPRPFPLSESWDAKN